MSVLGNGCKGVEEDKCGEYTLDRVQRNEGLRDLGVERVDVGVYLFASWENLLQEMSCYLEIEFRP